MAKNTKVGVLLVHGIGEQRRFSHLEAEVRQIVLAIEKTQAILPEHQRSRVTLDIRTSADAAFNAENVTWLAESAPSVRVDVLSPGNDLTEIHFREVWWADLDEHVTAMHRVRFWAWGWSQWSLRGHRVATTAGGATHMYEPGNAKRRPPPFRLSDRAKLFAVGMIFALILGTFSAIDYIGKRIGFRLAAAGPDRIALGPGLIVKYVGDVKLYQQKKWVGQGALQDHGYYPRVVVRRRMVRALVDMALEDYDRWYVLAHSLGTIVAHNGLMETGHCLPNYLDQNRWNRCVGRGIGSALPAGTPPDPTNDMMPERPAWLADQHVIFRDKLFDKLQGLLTYGCPLDKFATLWPAIVPLNKDENVFPKQCEWINVFDALDPVAGALDEFNPIRGQPVPGSGGSELDPKNLSYKSHWFFALSHVRYMKFSKCGDDQLVTRVARWLLDGGTFPIPAKHSVRWLPPTGAGTRLRGTLRYAQWSIMVAIMAVLIAIWVPLAATLVFGLAEKWTVTAGLGAWVETIWSPVRLLLTPPSWNAELQTRGVLVVVVAAVIVFVAGLGRILRRAF